MPAPGAARLNQPAPLIYTPFILLFTILLYAVVFNPAYTRVSDSVRRGHRDRNFAAFFPFIDILLGTYRRPAADEYPPTGLPGETPGGLRAATVGPLRAWYNMARRRLQSPPA